MINYKTINFFIGGFLLIGFLLIGFLATSFSSKENEVVNICDIYNKHPTVMITGHSPALTTYECRLKVYKSDCYKYGDKNEVKKDCKCASYIIYLVLNKSGEVYDSYTSSDCTFNNEVFGEPID